MVAAGVADGRGVIGRGRAIEVARGASSVALGDVRLELPEELVADWSAAPGSRHAFDLVGLACQHRGLGHVTIGLQRAGLAAQGSDVVGGAAQGLVEGSDRLAWLAHAQVDGGHRGVGQGSPAGESTGLLVVTDGLARTTLARRRRGRAAAPHDSRRLRAPSWPRAWRPAPDGAMPRWSGSG